MNRYDEPCILYDKDPPERRQTELVRLRGGERKLTPKQIVGRTIAYLLLFLAAYLTLRAF